SERIDKQRGGAARRRRGTNCAVIEIQRIIENIRLSLVVALDTQYDVPRRLVAVRKPSGGGDRVGVKKTRVRHGINRSLMSLRIPTCAQVGDDPCTETRVVACQLRSVVVVTPAEENAWIEHPRAKPDPFPVLADWSYLLFGWAERTHVLGKSTGHA